MNFQFTHPLYLFLLPACLAWIIWLHWKSDSQISPWRRRTALTLRLLIVTAAVLAIAGLQWKQPMEGLNVFFVLDRSDSIPSPQQEAARKYANDLAQTKKPTDRAGVLVFGTDASLETEAKDIVDVQKINAVVGTERTDIAGALRLGTAAFPETGQKRLVLISDGNENVGDALAAILAARPLGVTVDVVPINTDRGHDTVVQKLSLPSRIKKGQTFEAKIFVASDIAQDATIRLYRNDQPLGEQRIQITPGKNLYTFPQTLAEPGFYSYNVQLDAPGDRLPQNNRATSYTYVRGEP
ncbi:MAG TPA: VWA domain-containing protein, partial [Verrucomicrobiae bacterium]|nr:VWA domain-containing protein [Verrucomicrobiae bacterium]